MSKAKGKQKTKVDDLDYSVDDPEIDEEDPEIEAVENEPEKEMKTVKFTEKYEYKPVVNTEIVFLDPVNRVTSECMTRFEYTEIISQRAKQIENGGPCFTDTDGISDPIEMAKKELCDKKCPLNIIRPITNFVAEKWSVNEMAIPADY